MHQRLLPLIRVSISLVFTSQSVRESFDPIVRTHTFGPTIPLLLPQSLQIPFSERGRVSFSVDRTSRPFLHKLTAHYHRYLLYSALRFFLSESSPPPSMIRTLR